MATALLAQCDALLVCGRAWGGHPMVADLPGPGFGPLGGLCAALHHARDNGFDEVLAAPCDLLGLDGAAATLAPAPAVADGQWLLGLWPAALAPLLTALLEAEGAVSARRWITVSGAAARPVIGLRNINTVSDLG